MRWTMEDLLSGLSPCIHGQISET